MQIDFWTLALQAINFLILVWLLRRFLYAPVKQVIEKRRALAEQAFAEAKAQQDAAEEAHRRYDADHAALAQERESMIEAARAELDAERANVLAEARAQAEKILEDAKTGIAKERQAALHDLREDVASLGVELARKLLREAGQDLPHDLFLDRLAQRIADLPEEERTQLCRDIDDNGHAVAAVTARPLSDEEQATWTARLRDILGVEVTLRFEADADILGGAELRFPHGVLKLTWADQLTEAEGLMRKNGRPA